MKKTTFAAILAVITLFNVAYADVPHTSLYEIQQMQDEAGRKMLSYIPEDVFIKLQGNAEAEAVMQKIVAAARRIVVDHEIVLYHVEFWRMRQNHPKWIWLMEAQIRGVVLSDKAVQIALEPGYYNALHNVYVAWKNHAEAKIIRAFNTEIQPLYLRLAEISNE
jgi:hypothetical protein